MSLESNLRLNVWRDMRWVVLKGSTITQRAVQGGRANAHNDGGAYRRRNANIIR